MFSHGDPASLDPVHNDSSRTQPAKAHRTGGWNSILYGQRRHKSIGSAPATSDVGLNIMYRLFGAEVVPLVEGQASTAATSRDPWSCISPLAPPPTGRPTNSKRRCNSRMRPASVCGKMVVRGARLREGASWPRGGRASRVPCRSATKKTQRASAARLEVTQARVRATKALPARARVGGHRSASRRRQRPALPRILSVLGVQAIFDFEFLSACLGVVT